MWLLTSVLLEPINEPMQNWSSRVHVLSAVSGLLPLRGWAGAVQGGLAPALVWGSHRALA